MILAGWITGCSKNETPSGVDGVISTVTNGLWKITYCLHSGADETSKFSGYQFNFTGNGILVADYGSLKATGVWSAMENDGTLKLIISFTDPAGFVKLTDDWIILEITNEKIRLENSSKANSGTDLLTFEKV